MGVTATVALMTLVTPLMVTRGLLVSTGAVRGTTPTVAVLTGPGGAAGMTATSVADALAKRVSMALAAATGPTR